MEKSVFQEDEHESSASSTTTAPTDDEDSNEYQDVDIHDKGALSKTQEHVFNAYENPKSSLEINAHQHEKNSNDDDESSTSPAPSSPRSSGNSVDIHAASNDETENLGILDSNTHPPIKDNNDRNQDEHPNTPPRRDEDSKSDHSVEGREGRQAPELESPVALDSPSFTSVNNQGIPTENEIRSTPVSTTQYPSSPSQAQQPFTTSPSDSANHFRSVPIDYSHSQDSEQNQDSVESILRGIFLVGFDHALGPVIEFSHPPQLSSDPILATHLPFLALPDGAHLHDEDCCYFHIEAPSVSSSTLFGISCNRQIRSDELLNRGAEVTRSIVQKAIVVMTTKPLFGPIRDKLIVITRALFAQRDFQSTDLLVDFYSSLEASLSDPDQVDDSSLYMGTSVRELIYKFRHKTLVLVKLLLLQRRVMFYGGLVEKLCSFQYSLISLIPLLLSNLDDAAAANLNEKETSTSKPTELRTSDRQSLLTYIGFPLHIFGTDALFQPYLPLQQVEYLSAGSWVVGTTNKIFQQQKDCHIDVLVNVDTGSIDFIDNSLSNLVQLTAPDRKFIDDVVSTVVETWKPEDPTRPINMKFVGSDDFIRGKFEEYLCGALASIKYTEFTSKGNIQSQIMANESGGSESALQSFNEPWANAFKRTRAGQVWIGMTDDVIFDLVEPRHPCQGQTHMVEDMGIWLSQGMRDLRIDENLAPTRDVIAKGFASGSETVWGLMNNVRNDFARRQTDFKEWREQQQNQKRLSTAQRESMYGGNGGMPGSPVSPSSRVKPLQLVEGRSPNSLSATSQTNNTGPSALASSFGSFFSQKRSQLWTGSQSWRAKRASEENSAQTRQEQDMDNK